MIEAWLASAEVIVGHAASLERTDGAWRVLDEQGAVLAQADAVCIAAGAQARALEPTLPLAHVRGQASWARTGARLNCALAWGGYAVPFDGGLLFGATHDREREDLQIEEGDHRRNLATLAEVLPDLARGLEPSGLFGRASVRAAAPDRMPLAGALGEEGLFILGGLGSRGFVTAPLLGEHVAAAICGAPSPMPKDGRSIVDPLRFGLAGPLGQAPQGPGLAARVVNTYPLKRCKAKCRSSDLACRSG